MLALAERVKRIVAAAGPDQARRDLLVERDTARRDPAHGRDETVDPGSAFFEQVSDSAVAVGEQQSEVAGFEMLGQ